MAEYGNDSIIPGFDEERGDHLNIFLERAETERSIVVHLGDRLDTYNTDYFERAMGMVLAAGYTKIVFACAELGFVSASGMATFSKMWKILHEKGGTMAFAEVQPRVADIFEILGLTGFFPFRASIDKALEEVAREPAKPVALKSMNFTCPGCGRKLTATKAGKFICSSCRTRILLSAEGLARAC
ncbi:MAG TPA: STAS domain-containing protein [Rectinemataceae bacterium]|nr:STAS domain-containing protein [Rectinemataceae bacterium]